jgi:hypothetical protein
MEENQSPSFSSSPGSVSIPVGPKSKNSTLSSSIGMEFESNPNQRLSSVTLNEFNYHPWSRAITLALGGRSKLSFIDESTPSPDKESPDYASWLSKDQLVRSWILNSMDQPLAEIFSYSDSAAHLWTSVRDMYGQQNNSARIFELQRDIVNLQQSGKPFVQLLGNLKRMWNELEVYRPHTTDAVTLRKRVEEDKVFQLLASLGAEYEDLRSHILMSSELPSLSAVCSTIQREEVRKKVMNAENKSPLSDAHAFSVNRQPKAEGSHKGKRSDSKCQHCHYPGHVIEKCWVLHPELKPKFTKDRGPSKHKAHVVETLQGDMVNNSNPISLISEFAAFLKLKEEKGASSSANSTALLGNFAGLADRSENPFYGKTEGMSKALSTALKFNTVHDFWIVDSGATDHMTNKLTNLVDFEKFSSPSHVSVANGYGVPVIGKGKLKLFPNNENFVALYVPSFPVQLPSVSKLTQALNCRAIFLPHIVLFQDLVTKKTIGEGFFLQGVYYISGNFISTKIPEVATFSSSLTDHILWHQRLAHPSNNVLTRLLPDT